MKRIFAFVLCTLLVLSSVPVGALTLENVESAEEAVYTETPENAALQSSGRVLDETKGVRILYEDFETFTTFATNSTYDLATFDTEYMSSATITTASTAWATLSTVAETAEHGIHYLRTGRSDVAHTGVIFAFNGENGMTPKAGKYTTEYDQMVAAGSTSSTVAGAMDRIYYNTTSYSDRWHNDYSTKLVENAGAWVHETLEWTAADNGDGTFSIQWGSTLNNVSVLSDYRIQLKSSNNQWTDNFAIWHYPANALMFKNGTELAMAKSTGDTYTFPVPSTVFTGANDNLVWTDGESLFYPGTAYTTADVAVNTYTLTERPAPERVLDETKGIRILYEDFETFTTFATNSTYDLATFDTEYMSSATITTASTAWATLSTVAETAEHGIHYLRTGRSDVAHTGVIFAFNGTSGMTPKAGKYTTEYDQMVAAGSTSSTVAGAMDRIYYNSTSYSDRWHNDFATTLISNAGAWAHETLEWTAADNGNGAFSIQWGDNTLSDVSVLSDYRIQLKSSNNQWTDNFAIWHYPANSFMVKNGDELTLITAESDAYTFTAEEGVAGYKLGDKIFRAGNVVPVSTLEYNTLEVVTEIKPVIDENKGIRILYEDFEYFGATGNNVTTPVANINTDYMTSAALSVSAVGWADLTAQTDDGVHGAKSLRTGRGDVSHTNVVFKFNGENGMAPKAGKYTAEYDQKVGSTSTSSTVSGALDRIYYNSTSYSDRWHNDFATELVANAGSWVHETLEWTAADNGDGTFNVVWGDKNLSSVSVLTSYNVHLKSSSNQWTDNFAIWHYPANAFMLKNGESVVMKTVDADTYTFEAPSAVFGGAFEGIISYTSGTTTYYVGETANLADIANKTWTLNVVAEPKTLNVASMRTLNPQGIRIAGFVTTDLREKADEYGFVVALASSFENEAAYTNLTVANEDVKKVVAACYSKGTKDVYFIDASESTDAAKATFGDAAYDELGMYFTGVYANVPKTAAAYNQTIVGRTYVKIGDDYFYGIPVAKSVYSVAVSLKAKYEALGQDVPAFITEAIGIAEGTAQEG